MEENKNRETERFSFKTGLEKTSEFMNRAIGGDKSLPLGLYLLIAFGVYALVNIVFIVVKLFN